MYEEFTPEYLKQRILERTNTDISKLEGSFASDMASGVAYNLHELFTELEALYSLIFFDGLCGDFLDRRCAEYGISRTQGSKATGSITITTRYDTTIPAGTYITSDDGYEYLTVTDATTTDSTATVEIEAESVGASYNAASTTVVRLTVSAPGVTAVELSSAIAGGADAESDDSLKNRLYNRIRAAGSGCINDYVTWAKETPGVGAVIVVPCFDGAGTVKVIISSGDYHTASAELVSNVAALIETKRPIGAVVTVCSVTETNINVTATITMETGYTLEAITEQYENKIISYCKTAAQNSESIKYSKIGALLMSIDGVTDYANLAVNGGTANISITEGCIPACGEVTLT